MSEQPNLIIRAIHDDKLVEPDMSTPEHQHQQCVMEIDGRHSLPAGLSLLTYGPTREASEAIILRLCHPDGLMLHCALPPATARLFAQSVLSAAGDVEAAALAQASDALRKAGGAQP